MNNSQVAHIWANQTKDSAKGSNFYFEGPVIYSYGGHFPIAYNDNQQRIFFTIDKYSNTTAKHISKTRSACSHIPIIWVKYVPNKGTFEDNDLLKGWQYQNITYWVRKINEAITAYQASPKKTTLLETISYHVSRLQSFMNALNITNNKAANGILASEFMQNFDSLLQATNEKRRKSQEKRYASQIEHYNILLKEWRNFEREETPYAGNLPVDHHTFLRLNTVKNRIETSKGVKVPVAIAAKFWDYIINVLPEGCNGSCNYKIMDYSVKEISTERVVVGCHDIPMEECNKIALALGWRVLEAV